MLQNTAISYLIKYIGIKYNGIIHNMTATKNEDIFLFYMNKIVLFLKKRTDRTLGKYLNYSILRKNGKPMDR